MFHFIQVCDFLADECIVEVIDMKMKIILIMRLRNILLMILFLVGCSSASLKVESYPAEADVEVISKNGARKSIGKTPININDIGELKTGDAFIISVNRVAFEPEQIFVPTGASDRQVEIKLNLKEQKTFSINPNNQVKILNEIASSVADIQRLIQIKQYDIAKQKISSMMGAYPSVGIYYSFMGNIYYLERNISQAIFYYSKALDIDPSAVETRNVLEKLQNLKKGGE